MGNKDVGVIEEMNQKISSDLGVEDKTKKKNKYYGKLNKEERIKITRARTAALEKEGSVLDFLNEEIRADEMRDKSQEMVESQQNYEECLEQNKYLNIVFSTYDVNGNYEARDGKKTVILENEEMKKYGQENTYKQKAIFLNRRVCVKVKCIDGDKVYVVPAGSTEQALRVSTKELVNNEIARKLANGVRPVVFGRVLRVQPHSVMVNILDVDIIGFINTSHWSKLYTRTLEGLCKEGDYMQFEVIRPAEKKEGKDSKAWILGRENICPNPWDDTGIETLQVGNIMIVKCTEKPEGKTYWWGVTDRLPGVEVMGDYTYNYSDTKGIFAGLSYQCKVTNIDKNERNGCGYKVKVVPIVVVDEDKESLQAIRRVKGIQSEGGKK